jgi:hypothetical protein
VPRSENQAQAAYSRVWIDYIVHRTFSSEHKVCITQQRAVPLNVVMPMRRINSSIRGKNAATQCHMSKAESCNPQKNCRLSRLCLQREDKAVVYSSNSKQCQGVVFIAAMPRMRIKSRIRRKVPLHSAACQGPSAADQKKLPLKCC